jgi:hypothetical protein
MARRPKKTLRRRVHARFELRLFVTVCREALEEEGTKTGSSAAAEGVEDKKALEATAVIRESADFVYSRSFPTA